MSYPPHGPPPPHYTPHPKYPWPQGTPFPEHFPHEHGPPPGPYGPPPGPYGPPHHWPPPGHHPPPHGYPYYLPTMMVPVPMSQPEQTQSQPTYITNHIYQGSDQPPTYQPPAITEQVQVVESSGDFEWVPTTSTLANTLTGRAVVGGHEGWDGSPLWVIRASHNGDLIPGKLSVRHNAASIPYNGKEVPVQNIEVLCSRPEGLRWVPAADGNVPPSAIPGGNTSSGDPIYVGRAKYQLSITPGKVQPSQSACYISFAGAEVANNMYDVLCRVS